MRHPTLLPALLLAALAPTAARAESVPAPAERLARSASDLKAMRQALRQALAQREEARRRGGPAMVACVDEHLTYIKAQLRLAEQADLALQEAQSRTEPALAQREFQKVEGAAQQAAQHRADAEACLGSGPGGSGTRIEYYVVWLPTADTDAQPPAPPRLTVPPPASQSADP